MDAEFGIHREPLLQKVDHGASLLRHEPTRGIDRVDRLRLRFIAVQQCHEAAFLDFVGEMPDRRIADAEAREDGFAYAFGIARPNRTFDLDADSAIGAGAFKTPVHAGGEPGKGDAIVGAEIARALGRVLPRR